jgi:hypothetical protein
MAEALGVSLLALAPRLVGLDHSPQFDEMYHVLAARGWLADGSLQIPGGMIYSRGALFSYVVAWLFWTLGEGLQIARMPSVVAGTALVTLLFVWLRGLAGRTAAWVAAALLASYPVAIYLSQLARFYTPQALALWIAAVAVFALVVSPPRTRGRKIALGAVGLACAAVAVHLHVLSIVGLAALGAWAAGSVFAARLARTESARSRLALCAGAAILLLALAGTAHATGLAAYAREMTSFADLWAQGSVDNSRYYHRLLLDHYPTLWTLFPALWIVAAWRFPREAVFCGWMFAAPFAYHSIAAWKTERYLFYAMPAFFAVIGLAAAVILPALWRALDRTVDRLGGRWLPAAARTAVVVGVLAGSALFAAMGNRAFAYTLAMMTTDDGDWPFDRLYRGEPDWEAAVPALAPVVDESAIVLASAAPKALYYLDRVDGHVAATELVGRFGRAPEFSRDTTALGRPAISTPE